MKKYYIIGLLLIAVITAKSQTPVEVFTGNQYGVFDIRFSRPFADKSRFSLFSKNLFEYDYENQKTSFDVLQNVNFNLTKHFGLVTTIRLNSNFAAWRNGIRFLSETKHFFYTGQLVYELSTSTNRIAYLNIARVTLPLNKHDLYFYSQLDFLGGVNSKSFDYINSSERLRIGIGYKEIQLGVATNQEQKKEVFANSISNRENYGLFIRKIF